MDPTLSASSPVPESAAEKSAARTAGFRSDRPIAGSFLIVGLTANGKGFRPSDWAERLCGVMAPYRPGGAGRQSHLSYSPYVVPRSEGDVKCVLVDGRINRLEPMAYDFLVGFARDNDLQLKELEQAPSNA
jgi:Protein of unknown function (DUF3579)